MKALNYIAFSIIKYSLFGILCKKKSSKPVINGNKLVGDFMPIDFNKLD
jgi:hypothetical protein